MLRYSDLPAELTVTSLTDGWLNLAGIVRLAGRGQATLKLGELVDHKRLAVYQAILSAVDGHVLKIEPSAQPTEAATNG